MKKSELSDINNLYLAHNKTNVDITNNRFVATIKNKIFEAKIKLNEATHNKETELVVMYQDSLDYIYYSIKKVENSKYILKITINRAETEKYEISKQELEIIKKDIFKLNVTQNIINYLKTNNFIDEKTFLEKSPQNINFFYSENEYKKYIL